MKQYLADVKGGSFKIFMLITMIAILLLTVLGAGYKVIGDKMATGKPGEEADNNDDVQDKKDQVKEPLLE